MGRGLVCTCNMVSEREILKALKSGARSTTTIQKATGAGTSCGKCLTSIDSMVEEYNLQQPDNSQQRINFEE